jgi:tetratricopeptide (TPR) repeat protein
MLFKLRRYDPSMIMRADRAREAGQWQLAAGLYRIALDRKPQNPPIWIQYGHALKESGRRSDAEAAYRTALSYEPKDADAHLHLGHVLKLQGKVAEAMAAYSRALALDSSLSDAARELRELGGIETHLAETTDGAARVSIKGNMHENGAQAQAPAGSKRHKESIIERADRARDASQWGIATDLYRTALDRNPKRSDIWVQYGHALKESGRLTQAESAYRAALAREPSLCDTHVQLGHVLKLQGKQEEAEAAYLRAFALNPHASQPLIELRRLGWSISNLLELCRLQGTEPPAGIEDATDADHGIENIIPRMPGAELGGEDIQSSPAEANLALFPIEVQVQRLRDSALFDADWYLTCYPDVAVEGADPVEHFVVSGAAERRNPNSYFKTASYYEAFPELTKATVNPLLHFLMRQRRVQQPDVSSLEKIIPRGQLAVVLHLFDPSLWEEMREAVQRIKHPFDLFVSVTRGSSDHLRYSIVQAFPYAYILEFEDHGRDVGAFFVFLQSGVLFRYDLVCKIHTKRSPHRLDGDSWRRALISGVLGSTALVDKIVANFGADRNLGLVVATGYLVSGSEAYWTANERWLNRLLPRLGISEVNDCRFPAGNIFWMRASLLQTLTRLSIEFSDFEPEPLFIDGGLGHAIERIFGLICREAGMRAVEHGDLLELPQTAMRTRIAATGLFDPTAYLSLNSDLRRVGADAWDHYLKHGLQEGRGFTSAERVAHTFVKMDEEMREQRDRFLAQVDVSQDRSKISDMVSLFRRQGIRVGVFWNSQGNFFIRELAELLVWGLRAEGVDAILRDQTANKDERLDLRVIVAPHEFYVLGEGESWKALAHEPNTVFYNTEQLQTKWFALAFPFLLDAPLVLDINFQSTVVLRRACREVVHFMPGHLPNAPYSAPSPDVADIELLKGYSFSQQSCDWTESDNIEERPIDILFIGSHSPRRGKALTQLRFLADNYRFLCVYTPQDVPLREALSTSTSTRINCAIARRSKIVLNVHRDWLGYFEWSRLVMQGFWQGACVVSEPCLQNPLFEPGVHYLEEDARSLGALIDWLLGTKDGRDKLESTRRAGREQARSSGSMGVALTPVIHAFKDVLGL